MNDRNLEQWLPRFSKSRSTQIRSKEPLEITRASRKRKHQNWCGFRSIAYGRHGSKLVKESIASDYDFSWPSSPLVPRTRNWLNELATSFEGDRAVRGQTRHAKSRIHFFFPRLLRFIDYESLIINFTELYLLFLISITNSQIYILLIFKYPSTSNNNYDSK